MSQITTEDANQIAARFNAVAPNAKCPLCGTEEFGISQVLVELPVYDKIPTISPLFGPAGYYICAPLICEKCGHVMLVNLQVLGELEHIIDRERIPAYSGNES